jgi:cytoskeleton protein RodZ
MVLPQLHWEQAAVAPEPAPAAAMPPAGNDPATTGSPAGVAATPPVAAARSMPEPTPAAAVPPVAVAAPATAASMPAAVPASPSAAATALPAGSGIVVFQPRGETWVQVTDANGVVALRKTLAAGETTGASGALPLAVIVGRADATVVEVRGKAFDLAPVSVARQRGAF